MKIKRLVEVREDGTEVWEEIEKELDFGVDPAQYPPLSKEQADAFRDKIRAFLDAHPK